MLLAELNNNNTAYRPYFDALPGADDIISSESLDDTHISLLQDPQLVRSKMGGGGGGGAPEDS